MENRMKAVAYRQYGSADVLEVMELPRPTLNPNSVLIRVAAAGVNPADWVLRRGALKLFVRLKFPFVPGADVSGVVAAVGSAVTRFRPGDAVYAMLPNAAGGGYAEYAVAAENLVAPMPANLNFAEAAAIPLAALTALQGLRDHAAVKPGMHVLINGASGGVGSFAIQIAKAMGAHVTAVSSSVNLLMVKTLGADEAIDYTSENVKALKQKFDVIFDTVGVFNVAEARKLLAKNGVFISINPTKITPIDALLARFAGLKAKGYLVKPGAADLQQISQWLLAGKIKPVIEECYDIEDAADAQRHSETGRVRGKLVLIVDESLAMLHPTLYEAAA
jgi:NADPH:quinone reductase-like Zn-dependent oxidoreductase